MTGGWVDTEYFNDVLALGMGEWEGFRAMMEETFSDPYLLAEWQNAYDEMIQLDDLGQMARFLESKGVDFRNGEMPSDEIWAEFLERMSGAALPDAYMAMFTSNIGITGSLHFNKNAKVVVKGGDATLVSYKPGADATGEGWTFADGLAMEDHIFDARITAADDAIALIDIRRMGRLRIGYTADMGLWDAQNTTACLSGGTLTLDAPTTFLFDYTRVTGGVDAFDFGDESYTITVDKAPQLILGKGGKLVGVEKLTLGINGDTAPADLAVNGAPVHAVFIGSEWRYDTTVSEADRIANATADLDGLNLAGEYQYGLFKIAQVGVENLALTTTATDLSDIYYGDDYGVINYDPQAVSGQTDAYITGMVTKVKADDVIDPGVTDKGFRATAALKKVFDDYVPGGNPFVDNLYAGMADDPAAAYVGLATGVFADAAAGGAAIALQAVERARNATRNRLHRAENIDDAHVVQLQSAADAFANLRRRPEENSWRAGRALWAAPLYSHERGKNLRLGGVPAGFKADFGGSSLGVDYTTHDHRFRFGFAGHLGGGRSKSTGQINKTKNDFTFGGVELFAGARFGGLTLALDAGWARNANELNITGLNKAKYDTDTWSARLGAEYAFHAGAFNIIPGLAAEYAHLRQDAFRLRAGAAAAFESGRGSADVVNLPVSLRVNRDFALRCGTLTPEIKGGWIPSVRDVGLRNRVRVPGAAGRVNAASPMADRHTGEIGVSVKYDRGRYSAGLEYEYQFSSHFREHNVNAFLGVNF